MVEDAVLDVARHDVSRLCDAVMAVQVPRALRMLDGLQAEGEAAVFVHYKLTFDPDGNARVLTQSVVCTLRDGLVGRMDLVCSGFRELA